MLFCNLGVLSCIFTFWSFEEAIFNILSKFTNWTLLITLTHQLIHLFAASDEEVHFKHGLLAAAHLTFEAGVCFNIAVVSVYWLAAHNQEMDREPYLHRRIHAYNVHIFPSLAMLVNYIWLDVRIAFTHVKTWALFAIFYLAVNYYQTKAQGYPIYDQLTWEDETSFLIAAGIVGCFSATYYLVHRLSFYLKPVNATI